MKNAGFFYGLTRMASARMVQTECELRTGGKRNSSRKNLFVLNSRATGVGNAFWPEFDVDSMSYTISPTAIQLGKLGNLGNDGKLYKVLSDNTSHDVTPRINGSKYFTYELPVATKHVLHIAANGWPLADDRVAPDAKFCVGQNINLTSYMTPSIDDQVSTIQAQWFPPNVFVNYIENWPEGAKKYLIEWDLLLHRDTSLWYVTGGEKHPRCDWTMTFNNGQTVKLITSGRLTISRPTAVMVNQAQNGPPTVLWTAPWSSELGFHHGAIALGIQSTTNNMSYLLRIFSPDFYGDAKITQLCTIDASGLDTGCTDCLDVVDPYTSIRVFKNPNPTGNMNLINLDDAPDANTTTGTIYLNDSFQDYVMFKPDGDSIYVPIALVMWSVSASVIYPNTTISQSVTGPTRPTDCTTFPFWLNVRH